MNHRLHNSWPVYKNLIQKAPIFIPWEILKQTLRVEGYQQNRFVQNLLQSIPFPFPKSDVETVVSTYFVGTELTESGFSYTVQA